MPACDQTTAARPVVLVFVSYYLPGHRSGGPVRSIANLVEALGDEYDFRIVTRDRDVDDGRPYPNVPVERWVEVSKARVYYLRPNLRGSLAMARLLRRTPADLVYLNSFFSFMFSIMPVLLMALMPWCAAPIVLAPRGEFSPGALRFKALKKAVFLSLVRWVGMYRQSRFTFQASSSLEAEDIIREMSGRVRTLLAAPFPAPYIEHESFEYPRVVTALDLAGAHPLLDGVSASKAKPRGALDVVWISRIVGKKNLDGALSYLKDLDGDIRFTIYGPVEDRRYWASCRRIIDELPPRITVTYGGELASGEVIATLASHHVLLFPTFGENYGHVISEALAAGCPVIISDRTPWRGLVRAGVGWDIDLNDDRAFVAALQQCVDMDAVAFDEFAARACAYAASHRNSRAPVDQHRRLFAAALS